MSPHATTSLAAGLENSMSDDASSLHDLADTEVLAHFNSTYPQQASCKLWTPTPSIISAVTLSLVHRQEAMRSGVIAQRAAGADTQWQLWSDFCGDLAVDALTLQPPRSSRYRLVLLLTNNNNNNE
jgi:hypothetical protein